MTEAIFLRSDVALLGRLKLAPPPRRLALFGIEEIKIEAAEHLFLAVAENCRHPVVDEIGVSLDVYNPDTFGRDFHHAPEPLFAVTQSPFGPLLFRHVPHQRH